MIKRLLKLLQFICPTQQIEQTVTILRYTEIDYIRRTNMTKEIYCPEHDIKIGEAEIDSTSSPILVDTCPMCIKQATEIALLEQTKNSSSLQPYL